MNGVDVGDVFISVLFLGFGAFWVAMLIWFCVNTADRLMGHGESWYDFPGFFFALLTLAACFVILGGVGLSEGWVELRDPEEAAQTQENPE